MSREKKEVLIFDDADEVSDFAVQRWAGISHIAVKRKERFEVALSGGKTPASLYKKLSDFKKSLPWNQTHIFLVDERFVPHDNSSSNYRMIKQALLKHVKIPEENIHPVPVDEDTSVTSAEKYERDLISHFKLKRGVFPQFDLIVLGIGEDGHTASLFPDTPSLNETQNLTAAVAPTDAFKHERITLTFPVINNAKNIIILARGSRKAGIVKEVIEEKNDALPAARIKPKNGKIFFFLDKNAASLLKVA